MQEPGSLQEVIEDHALERVPDAQRHTWLDLSWNTVGITSTLIQLYIGALVCFAAGIRIGLLAGVTVAVFGGLLAWGVGHLAHHSGLSSSLLSRTYGFGVRGSMLTASIFGFMIIGFIAAENVLLYKGFLFYLELQDSLTNQVLIYGLLTVCWVLLTTYGFNAVTRVSSLMLVSFMALLIYMMFGIVGSSGQSWGEVTGFGPQLSDATLRSLGAETPLGAYLFAVNILSGSAGALSLISADLGRYARSSRDIAIAAFAGIGAQDIIMVSIGAVILFAGMPALTEYYVNVAGVPVEQARAIAVENPDRVAAAFIVFGGALGAALMVAAQSKAQVLNAYSSSLSLANLFDAFAGWRPGRFAFIVLANLLSLLFLVGDILVWFNAFLVILGILTASFAGIMLADFFIARPWLARRGITPPAREDVNWSGVTTLLAAYVMAHHVLPSVIPVEALSAILVSLLVYPVLRNFVLLPRSGSTS